MVDYPPKDDLVAALKRIRGHLCSYRAGQNHIEDGPCDCKFGATNVGEPTEVGPGCPEINAVLDLLTTMTKAEYRQVWVKYYDEMRERVRRRRQSG